MPHRDKKKLEVFWLCLSFILTSSKSKFSSWSFSCTLTHVQSEILEVEWIVGGGGEMKTSWWRHTFQKLYSKCLLFVVRLREHLSTNSKERWMCIKSNTYKDEWNLPLFSAAVFAFLPRCHCMFRTLICKTGNMVFTLRSNLLWCMCIIIHNNFNYVLCFPLEGTVSSLNVVPIQMHN